MIDELNIIETHELLIAYRSVEESSISSGGAAVSITTYARLFSQLLRL